MESVSVRQTEEQEMLYGETQKYLWDFNQTDRVYDRMKTINQLFEAQVEKSADQIAAVYLGESITYHELNQKANQLARRLRECGVGSNDIVGLMVNRSLDMLVGIIGILKAGGCYLPIDPSYPEDRIAYMLEDSGTHILLTHQSLPGHTEFQGHRICLDDPDLYRGDHSNIPQIHTSADLAYVIYTSGSTGNPKGVMLRHFSVHNFIVGMRDQIDFTPQKSIVSLTTISFDIFVLESLLPLSMGMKIVIADPMELAKYLNDQKVDMLQTTPSTMRMILNDPNNLGAIAGLSEIMLGGEAFPKRLLLELRTKTKARIYNMYGPTETTVWSAVKDLTDAQDITIGKPIANTQIYITDANNLPLGIDAIGELCIAGDGLAKGYLNRAQLTNERFVANPVVDGCKMYKTGDMAKWLSDGEILFLGRKDSQVKIRGFRIELGEIEAALLKQAQVKECVVAAKENDLGEKYLVAYYVADQDLLISDLIELLGKSLPEYMIPGFYLRIEKIPLTPNNKIDRNRLPKPDNKRPSLANEFVAPETNIENQLAEIWGRVLNREQIGINDNFFELGGNSILVSQIHLQLEKRFPGKVNLVDIFAFPSISRLARLIEAKSDKAIFGQAFAMLTIPSAYFGKMGGDPGEMVVKAAVNLQTVSGLERLAVMYHIRLQSIFLATYMHLISELWGLGSVGMLVPEKATGSFREIRIDFTQTSDLGDLCSLIEGQVEGPSQLGEFWLDDLNQMIVKENQVLPLFYYDQNRIRTNHHPGHELVLQIKREEAGLWIHLAFNSGILRAAQVENLLQNYTQLLAALTETI